LSLKKPKLLMFIFSLLFASIDHTVGFVVGVEDEVVLWVGKGSIKEANGALCVFALAAGFSFQSLVGVQPPTPKSVGHIDVTIIFGGVLGGCAL
jgi:hypothetical protein